MVDIVSDMSARKSTKEIINAIEKLPKEALTANAGTRNLAQQGFLNDDPTFLHMAAGLGNTELISYLVEHGVDVNIRTNDMTPLMWAAWSGQEEAIKLLLDYGADKDISFKRTFIDPGGFDVEEEVNAANIVFAKWLNQWPVKFFIDEKKIEQLIKTYQPKPKNLLVPQLNKLFSNFSAFLQQLS